MTAAAESIEDVVRHGQTVAQKSYHNYGRLSADVAAKVKAAGGPDVGGYEHRIEADAVRKVLADHAEDLQPVTEDDFKRLAEIVDKPDKVGPSGKRTKQGLDAIQYEKRFSGTTMIVVEEVRTGRKKLALKTMYKRPG
jgi:hypothetical protein